MDAAVKAADVVIVGGGPVGSALALALALTDADLRVVVLESRARGVAVTDPRPLALSYGSRLMLERLGVWDALGASTPIAAIHVSQQGGFGRVAMRASEAGVPALGYVVEYARLQSAFDRALEARGDDIIRGVDVTDIRNDHEAVSVGYRERGGEALHAVAARIVAVADGGAVRGAPAKLTDYRQCAVVAMVKSELPHGNAAYERFTPHGPLALLPCDDDLALVWSMDTEAARARSEEASGAFLAHLHDAFGGRLGGFIEVGTRSVYPLSLRLGRACAPRTLYIGNASQALHPVAGQGLNLGLRDAWELAEAIRDADGPALGSPAMLKEYERRRRIDRRGGVGFTDALVRLFSNDIAVLNLARGLGLAALDALPPARDFVARRMIFGARG